jgi:hypothetical protein
MCEEHDDWKDYSTAEHVGAILVSTLLGSFFAILAVGCLVEAFSGCPLATCTSTSVELDGVPAACIVYDKAEPGVRCVFDVPCPIQPGTDVPCNREMRPKPNGCKLSLDGCDRRDSVVGVIVFSMFGVPMLYNAVVWTNELAKKAARRLSEMMTSKCTS